MATNMSQKETRQEEKVAVVGPPTKDHWKSDSEALSCNYKDCLSLFGLFERRHHCRRCGDIFCSKHCSNYFRLDQHAQFNIAGTLSRGCDRCLSELHEERNKSFVSSLDNTINKKTESRNRIMTKQPQAMEGVMELSRDDIVQPVQENQPNNRNLIAIRGAKGNNNEGLFNPVAGSVPVNWHWSTF
ncbi:hypothetical protein BDB01DRAFT_833316 [Pilobolus umbonatus]|nr:hypothetical protein BDB01DRAFT_833316 [Pilobolus umbonatus]